MFNYKMNLGDSLNSFWEIFSSPVSDSMKKYNKNAAKSIFTQWSHRGWSNGQQQGKSYISTVSARFPHPSVASDWKWRGFVYMANTSSLWCAEMSAGRNRCWRKSPVHCHPDSLRLWGMSVMLSRTRCLPPPLPAVHLCSATLVSAEGLWRLTWYFMNFAVRYQYFLTDISLSMVGKWPRWHQTEC